VVFAKRPGGQAQFSAGLALATDPDFDTLHEWMTNNLRQDLSVPHLAARVGMSERSFARRYRAATGTTPSRAVERLRVEAAREALATSRRPVTQFPACAVGGAARLSPAIRRVTRTHNRMIWEYRDG
jgi:transcriptional regulator GlxA family with amidase domain